MIGRFCIWNVAKHTRDAQSNHLGDRLVILLPRGCLAAVISRADSQTKHRGILQDGGWDRIARAWDGLRDVSRLPCCGFRPGILARNLRGVYYDYSSVFHHK